jgi:hypothetical protein
MGIALVVPAYKILEVINQPELVEMRKKVNDASSKQTTKPTLDSAKEGQQKLPSGSTIPVPDRGTFFRDLTKVTRKREPSE